MGNTLAKLSDEELARLFSDRKESEKAFREFYSRSSRSVFAYCLKVLHDRDDAGDVFQEIYTTFFNMLKNGTVIEKPMNYLMRITRTRCLNFKRDQAARKRDSTISFDENYMAHTETTDEMINRNERKEIFEKALAGLPDNYRDAFLMRIYNGLEYKDIAEIMGEDETTVRNLLFRARKKMKEFIALYMK